MRSSRRCSEEVRKKEDQGELTESGAKEGKKGGKREGDLFNKHVHGIQEYKPLSESRRKGDDVRKSHSALERRQLEVKRREIREAETRRKEAEGKQEVHRLARSNEGRQEGGVSRLKRSKEDGRIKRNQKKPIRREEEEEEEEDTESSTEEDTETETETETESKSKSHEDTTTNEEGGEEEEDLEFVKIHFSKVKRGTRRKVQSQPPDLPSSLLPAFSSLSSVVTPTPPPSPRYSYNGETPPSSPSASASTSPLGQTPSSAAESPDKNLNEILLKSRARSISTSSVSLL
jgi:hypothetical protein